jgi:hypothetical protein
MSTLMWQRAAPRVVQCAAPGRPKQANLDTGEWLRYSADEGRTP